MTSAPPPRQTAPRIHSPSFAFRLRQSCPAEQVTPKRAGTIIGREQRTARCYNPKMPQGLLSTLIETTL